MKLELKNIALTVCWLVLLSLVAPYLISSASTELVAAGFVLLLGSTYATYRYIRNFLASKEDRNALN